MNMSYVIVTLLLGFALGYISNMRRVIGVIRVDNSDPEDGPYLFLELETGMSKLKHGGVVSFKVNTKSYITQD